MHGAGRNRAAPSSPPAKNTKGYLIPNVRHREEDAKAIASALGVTLDHVRSELTRHGIPFIVHRARIDRDLLYKLYVIEGFLQREIAAKLQISTRVVYCELRRHEIRFRHGPHARRVPRFTREELVLLYVDQKQSVSVIGEKYGVGPELVRYWLKHYGITLDPSRRAPRGWRRKP